MQPWILVGVIVLIASSIYGPFLRNPILFDDNNFFGGAIHSEYLNTFFNLRIRWLPYASFEWTRVLLGLDILWFRLGNVVLHIATAVALFVFLNNLFETVLALEPVAPASITLEKPLAPIWFAFFGALIFALHPVAVYAAAYLIQRTILMATLFTLIMWTLFLLGLTRRNQWCLIASAGAYLLAVLSKEHAIMAPAVALGMLFLLHKPTRQLLKVVAPAFVLYGLIGAYIIFQVKSGNVLAQTYEPGGLNSLSTLAKRDLGFDPGLAYPLSILTQSFLFFKYLLVWILPNPSWMSIDMYEPFAMRLSSWPHWAGLVGFILYPIVAIWLLLKRGAKGLLGLAMLCPWLMFATELSTVRIQESFVLYRSYLWMPGVFAGMPFLFQKTPAKRTAVVLAALALVMIPVTWARLTTLSSPYMAWNDAARLIEHKDNRTGVERIYANRGLALYQMGYFKPAIEDYTKALALNPTFIAAYNNRGATYLLMKNYSLALTDYDKAIELNPKLAAPYIGRGLVYEKLDDRKAFLSNYQTLCSLNYVKGCMKLKTNSSTH